MLSKKIAGELNSQMNMEFLAAYSYLGMAGYCHTITLDGAGKWFELQAKEEMEHAMKFYGYLVDHGVLTDLESIAKPKLSFSSVTNVFEIALEHEQKVTESINEIATTAAKEADHTTYGFLSWFLKEQVEEVSTCEKILARLKQVGENPGALFMLDAELGRRSAE